MLVKIQLRRGVAVIAEKTVDEDEMGAVSEIFPEYSDSKIVSIGMVLPELCEIKSFNDDILDRIKTVFYEIR